MSLKEPHKIRVMKKLIVLIIYLFMFQYVSPQNASIIFKYQILDMQTKIGVLVKLHFYN